MMMTPKQRQIQRREEQILQVATELVREIGVGRLTMNQIAEAINVSRPTLYQHFASTEDLLVAAANKYNRQILSLFVHASMFPGGTRERMVAVGVAHTLYLEKYPDRVRITEVVPSLISKAIDIDRRDEARKLELELVNVQLGIVRSAVACGDLRVSDPRQADEVMLGLWMLVSGMMASMFGYGYVPEMGADLVGVSMTTAYRLADGYGWRPLTSEWDYTETERKARRYLETHEVLRPTEGEAASRAKQRLRRS